MTATPTECTEPNPSADPNGLDARPRPAPLGEPTDAGGASGLDDYLLLVRTTVAPISRRVPRHVEREELMAAGMEGLAQALRSYDPERGVAFEAYARRRIRGAVLDELRRRDWAGRVVRTRARRLAAATEALTSRLGRAPKPAEVAEAAHLSTAEITELTSHLDRAARLERHLLLGAPDGETVLDAADLAPGPDAQVLDEELRTYLLAAVEALPERLRWAVIGHFGEGREMKELAEELGVTPSRVSQLCGEAIALLREGITAQLDPPERSAPPRGAAARRRSAYVAAVAERAAQRRQPGGPVPSAA